MGARGSAANVDPDGVADGGTDDASSGDRADGSEPLDLGDGLDPFDRLDDLYRIYQHDPAANRQLMRRLEALVDWALLAVCPDSVLVGSTVYPRGRQTLDLGGELCRISFWAPDTVIEDLNLFLDAVREKRGPMPVWASMVLLVREAVTTWTQIHDKTKKQSDGWRIHERDEFTCQTPGCSCRRHLHGHHVEFQSQGGSDEPDNLASTCFGHHQYGIHDGHVVCRGNANRGLLWILGPRAKEGGGIGTTNGGTNSRPFRIYLGDLRIA